VQTPRPQQVVSRGSIDPSGVQRGPLTILGMYVAPDFQDLYSLKDVLESVSP